MMQRVRWTGAIVTLVVVLIAPPVAARRERARVFEAPVVAVSDGDTIVVRYAGKNLRVRLAEIDCPELKQPFGHAARAFTAQLVLDKIVRIEPKTVDDYDRVVARVKTSDGKDLGEELLRNGLAWWYSRYSRDRRLRALEAEARQAKRGLWADPDPIPPWLYRRMRPLLE